MLVAFLLWFVVEEWKINMTFFSLYLSGNLGMSKCLGKIFFYRSYNLYTFEL